jgi:hypothetical protein
MAMIEAALPELVKEASRVIRAPVNGLRSGRID